MEIIVSHALTIKLLNFQLVVKEIFIPLRNFQQDHIRREVINWLVLVYLTLLISVIIKVE